MSKYVRLTSIEMEILIYLKKLSKGYGLQIMNHINKGRRIYIIKSIGYGSFYYALNKLEEKGFIELINNNKKKKKSYKITKIGEDNYTINLNYEKYLNDFSIEHTRIRC